MATPIFFDTEFLHDGKARTTELLSVGMVTGDGREFYAVNAGFPLPWLLGQPWLLEHVVPSLPIRLDGDDPLRPTGIDWDPTHPDYPCVRPRDEIAADVLTFWGLPDTTDLELWAYCSGFDYVALCELFGTMTDSPDGMPHFVRDLAARREDVRELMRRRGETGEPPRPPDPVDVHNALADARWNRLYHHVLTLEYDRLTTTR